MTHDLALVLHIAAGTAGLILGPVAMRAAKRRGLHTRAGEAYHWVELAVAVTALVLAALDFSRIWWLALIALFSYGFALLGYLAAKRRWPGWLLGHVSGQGGSYIALVTALLTVNLGTDSVLAWLAPTLIGSPLIAWVNYQIAIGRRPKAWAGARSRTALQPEPS